MQDTVTNGPSNNKYSDKYNFTLYTPAGKSTRDDGLYGEVPLEKGTL